MCGIIACIGTDDAAGELLTGLENLEYRGYDSAGIAVQNGSGIVLQKRAGTVDDLVSEIESSTPDGTIGIGHTRWSTHGPPTDVNAHPHTSQSGEISVVHNGIIENHDAVRNRLQSEGYRFVSETDTEVIPNLVEYYVNQGRDTEGAFRAALDDLDGSYAVALLAAGDDTVYAARRDSPLVLGVADDCYYLASDVPAFLEFTDRVVYLKDGDVTRITPDDARVTDRTGASVRRPVETVEWNAEETGKGQYDHYMLKEIETQPDALANTLRGRITDDGAVTLEEFSEGTFADVDHVQLLACGTSYHAARCGARQLTQAGILAQAFRASEYDELAPVTEKTLVIALSQSGETADTLSAMRRASRRGATTVSVTNVVGSTASREADHALYIRAGPEIGVAATKTFTSQVATVSLLTHCIARNHEHGHPRDDARDFFTELSKLPDHIEQVIETTRARQISEQNARRQSYFFIGRGFEHAVALEGALKFKEITYEHAEGFASGELKHGPLALVTENASVFALLTGERGEETRKNAEEARTRGANVVAVASEGTTVGDFADETLRVPETHPDLAGLLANVQLQLVSYHTASDLGRAIDKPRNLAKSVTVE